MTITICGSMHFAKEILDLQRKLNKLGYNCLVPESSRLCLDNPELNMDFDFCIKNNVQMNHFNKIKQGDAILVANCPKNNINNYIGGATLMEIAIAQFLNKYIFILHDLPDENIIRHAFEVKLTQPIILSGDITRINNYFNP